MEYLAFVAPIWGIPVMPIQWDNHIANLKNRSGSSSEGDAGQIIERKGPNRAKAAMKKLKSKVQRGREKLRVTKTRWGLVEQEMELEQMPFVPGRMGGFDGAGDEREDGRGGVGRSTSVEHAGGMRTRGDQGQCGSGLSSWVYRQAWKSKERRYVLLQNGMASTD